jgi:hypothetical protein
MQNLNVHAIFGRSRWQPVTATKNLTHNLSCAGTCPTKLQLKPGLLIVVLSLLTAAPAFAVLGEDVASIQRDQAHIQASVRVTHTSAYSLHELQTPSGVSVREYVSPSGKVFAVAWHGPSRPDLKQLLGSHFEEFRQALQSQNQRHGPVFVQLPRLVVQLGGHMRDFVGRAYLPDQIPPGVRAQEIR